MDAADKYIDQLARLNKDLVSANNKYLANSDPQSPSRPAWQWMIEVCNDADPALQKAQIAERFARLYADATFYTSHRLAVATTLKDILKTGVPASLEEGTLAADVKTAQDAARDAFNNAYKELASIIDKSAGTETGKALIDAASVSKVVEQYARYAFAKVTNDPAADNYKKAAKDLAVVLNDRKVELPLPLPPEIAPPPPNVAIATQPSPSADVTSAASGANDTPEQAEVAD